MTSTVSVEISGPVATITFNRPRSLNAMTAKGSLLYRHLLMDILTTRALQITRRLLTL